MKTTMVQLLGSFGGGHVVIVLCNGTWLQVSIMWLHGKLVFINGWLLGVVAN